VASIEAVERLRAVAHEVIAVATPAPFYAVGAWYADFSQTEDDDVVQLLAAARGTDS
jgi:putative phosphoribosyl transferase